MRVAALLAELPDADLERLAAEHVRTDERLARPQLCNFLEGAIRSYRFVSGFLVNRQPPTFSMLTLLLESPGYARPIDGFRDAALAEARRLADSIDAGELLYRDRQLHLYRRAFYEARRNDIDVNASEAALLTVLRREQGIAQVEHFLIEHHKDLREFWDREHCYEHEEHALRSAGILFHSNGQMMIPEDVATAVWQTLGIDMPSDSARRLFGHLSNAEMADVLEAAGARTSGSKEQRLERILLERIQPRSALQSVGLSTLKDVCRATNAASTGSKDELIERIIAHFAQGRDQRDEEPVEVRLPEPRRLSQCQFETLFNALTHQELSDILRREPDLRQTGTKETRIGTLWDAQLSETTLLGELMNRQLEDILHRLGLRLSGSKTARLERIIEHFGGTQPDGPIDDGAQDSPAQENGHPRPPPAEVAANQTAFRQRASNPQASLQPWLDTLLGANGMVRCYATEDANPTKQLKNKLAQAAAARDGLLVLLLADESAYSKAREALIERWLDNDEWSKSVACVALAYPMGDPTVQLMVDRTTNPWSGLIQSVLFPNVEVVRVISQAISARCSECNTDLPRHARFCPHCGTPLTEWQTNRLRNE
jgi:zinc-ribbon domain